MRPRPQAACPARHAARRTRRSPRPAQLPASASGIRSLTPSCTSGTRGTRSSPQISPRRLITRVLLISNGPNAPLAIRPAERFAACRRGSGTNDDLAAGLARSSSWQGWPGQPGGRKAVRSRPSRAAWTIRANRGPPAAAPRFSRFFPLPRSRRTVPTGSRQEQCRTVPVGIRGLGGWSCRAVVPRIPLPGSPAGRLPAGPSQAQIADRHGGRALPAPGSVRSPAPRLPLGE